MKEVLLAKYGEVALKGLNKSTFENAMIKTMERRLSHAGSFSFTHAQSTVYIVPKGDECDFELAVYLLKHVFGIATINRAACCEKELGVICDTAAEYLRPQLSRAATFKVECRRADKRFPLNSMQLAAEAGGRLLEAFPGLRVDIHDPELTVHIEIRDFGAYIHCGRTEAAGGMPSGTSGRAAVMLSGGIDSPVAAYMMAKRGLDIVGVHFESPPYTSERALLKVLSLGQKVSEYCGILPVFSVPFADIQLTIRDNCPEELFTVLMRRSMVRVCEAIAKREKCTAMVTGESLAQVASQTLAAIVCTDAAAGMPILRPLIGMDKTEIIEIARRIDTFETSILPFEDCCTLFTPKHPRTRPTLAEIIEAEAAVDLEPLELAAAENAKLHVQHFYDNL